MLGMTSLLPANSSDAYGTRLGLPRRVNDALEVRSLPRATF